MRHLIARLIRKLQGSRVVVPTPHAVEQAEEIFYIRHLCPGMVVFDVGANVGELSLLFSRFVGASGSVHAFEASPKTFERLAAVVAATGRMNIHLNQTGVADKCGDRAFHQYDDEHSGWSTMATRNFSKYGIDLKPVESDLIQFTTLEDYCLHNQILLKHLS